MCLHFMSAVLDDLWHVFVLFFFFCFSVVGFGCIHSCVGFSSEVFSVL